MSKTIHVILLFVGIGVFGFLIYFGLNLTNDSKSFEVTDDDWTSSRTLIMASHSLHNLNEPQRDKFIDKYTQIISEGAFHDHAYIIDLQDEYSVGQPITFTVATWGYGHPCQSPSFVYYFETKDSANIVFEDEYVRLCQVLHEENYTNYYTELSSNQTRKASHDVYPVFDKPGNYLVEVDGKSTWEFKVENEN